MSELLKQIDKGISAHIPGLLDGKRAFAVLVPLVEREDGIRVLYEVRALTLRRQPGEVCFPGGHMEVGETPEQCALRETEEELGIPMDKIRVLGRLDFIAHRANFIMYPILALIDGNRDHGSRYAIETPHITIIKGDGNSASIAAASILAKVARDRYVSEELDALYPQYQFAKHKGYGTKLHYEMLDQYGPSPAHRVTFLKKWEAKRT